MNVLVYSGPEVLSESLKHTLSTLRTILVPHYTVQPVSRESLAAHPWSVTCALLVIPACHSPALSPSISNIRGYVENGGAFLALSAGAKYSPPTRGLDLSSLKIFDLPLNSTLRFHDKATSSFLEPRFQSTEGSSMSLLTLKLPSGEKIDLRQGASEEFEGFNNTPNVKVLAWVEDKVAAIRCDLGTGSAVIWAPGIEYSISNGFGDSVAAEGDVGRQHIMEDTLQQLGLQIPSKNASISHPLPQFLTANPTKSTIVSTVMAKLQNLSPSSPLYIFKGDHDADTFRFCDCDTEDASQVLQDARSRSTSVSEPEPPTWQPKDIIIYRDGKLPQPLETPLFNLDKYFTALTAAREASAANDSVAWGMGEVLLYSEAVTSTQTMLEQNPKFMSHLETPILSLASHQLTGRGRGTNIWLSPSGCLQFSLLLRVPLATLPASKLVFVQYLFGLAVAEACREDAVLGKVGESVRLKWPNDIYAVVGNGERKKIGGILVNTNFTADKEVAIVIGCGLNVLNHPPITSLSQLLPFESEVYLSMEHTAAAIVTKFEGMWTTFTSQRGSFEPFIRLYLERWLHSDQLVTLTTTTPSQVVRITGITPDHGLLRTLPERTGWSSGIEGFIDLQPDGNSFDIMGGLIKSKYK